MHLFKSFILTVLVTVLSGCLLNPGQASQSTPLSQVENWGYQLQGADPDGIAFSGFNLIVMDYSRDGTDNGMYSRSSLAAIAASGTVPIAYISVGEAEDYRFYWKKEWETAPPAWLGRENPGWEGNYKVRYWNPSWKKIIYSYIDKIVAQGFSGIYLDIIDAFEYWSDPENKETTHLTEADAAQRMIQLIGEIARYCHISLEKPDFYIIPQNGERILAYDKDNSFLETISGIGVEDLWYNETSPLPAVESAERIIYLDKIRQAGKPVFVVDYVDDGSGYKEANKIRIDSFIAKCRAHGYVPYVALSDRELDELNVIPGVQP